MEANLPCDAASSVVLGASERFGEMAHNHEQQSVPHD